MISLTAFDSIDDAVLKTLEAGLSENAVEKNAPPFKTIPLSVLARDAKGELIGGLTGNTCWDWLYIDVLWIKKEARTQGLGSGLVKKAEALALERGCHSSYLWTESFEAPDFYPKLGYQKFAMNEDFPTGHRRTGFMKRLAA
jgi:GNAT superfamily N-acetyltransferase